jgi:hypothetical protein
VTALESVGKPKEVQIMTKTKTRTGNTAARQPHKSARKPTASRVQQKQIAPAGQTSAAATPAATPGRQTKKGSILALL